MVQLRLLLLFGILYKTEKINESVLSSVSSFLKDAVCQNQICTTVFSLMFLLAPDWTVECFLYFHNREKNESA